VVFENYKSIAVKQKTAMSTVGHFPRFEDTCLTYSIYEKMHTYYNVFYLAYVNNNRIRYGPPILLLKLQ